MYVEANAQRIQHTVFIVLAPDKKIQNECNQQIAKLLYSFRTPMARKLLES